MLIRYWYLFIIFIYLVYLSGCNQAYDPYLVHAYNQVKASTPTSGDNTAELSEEWKKELEKITDPDKQHTLAKNIKHLDVESRDGLWRIFMSIPTKQQPRFTAAITSFDPDKQANLLKAILHLQRQDEKLIKVVLNGDINLLSIWEQVKLSNMLQILPASDQALLTKFEALIFSYNTSVR